MKPASLSMKPRSFRCEGCGRRSTAISLTPLCAHCRKVMPTWGAQLPLEPEDDDGASLFIMLIASVLFFAGLATALWYFVL
jgi:hypothetical protein